VDSRVGIGSVMAGPDSVMHLAESKTVTVKESVVIGKDASTFDCDYDLDIMNQYASRKYIKRQHPPVLETESAGMIFPEFVHKKTGFPACAHFELDIDVSLYGYTCVINTEFSEFDGKCSGHTDYVLSTNHGNVDHTFKMDFISGNSCNNCDSDTIIRFHRPDTHLVNPADCVDLHCDGLKRGIVHDGDGGIFGTAGTFFAEAEYEWDGVERNGATYSDTRDGLGDYRIPTPMKTRLDGTEIPVQDVYSHAGVVRTNDCDYRATGPGWFCPDTAGLQYYDLIYEMMDEDHLNRRLTPLAVRSNGYLDIINGPGDHSCCIGYACSQRLMTIHSTIACGLEYDYYFSSTLPVEAKFHLPYAPESCKIKVAFYTKRPNRVDIEMDGVFVPATNAEVGVDGAIEWQKPDSSFIPGVDSHDSGANYQERTEQLIHVVMSGGHTYTIRTVQTLVLELAVTTELTEDDFYDNGNLANNLAALLGIDPSRIRVMDVISESSSRRFRRYALENWEIHGTRTLRSTGKQTALRFEVTPEVSGNDGADALDTVAESVIANPNAFAESVKETLMEIDPTIETDNSIAVAAPPKEPETPDAPVTLAEQLGLDEMGPDDNLEDFIQTLNDAAGMDITTLETAHDKNKKEQEEADKAADLIVYDTPTTMVLDVSSVPTIPQLLEQRMFSVISLSVLDQNGDFMDTVGYVNQPYQVKVEMFNPVLGDGDTPSIDGETVVEFKAGNGYATFSNLILRGGLQQAQLRFSIKSPSDTGIEPVITAPINFMPAIDEGECHIYEGENFDRKITMTANCDYVCLTPCIDLSNLGGDSIGPQCNDVSSCEANTFSSCADGCNCDMESVPDLTTLKATDFMTTQCSAETIEVRLNKCVMNKFGFTLKDLFVNGPQKTDNFTNLETSINNNCRGALAFDNGPEYAFKIDRTFSDCKTEKGFLNGQATYKNAIHGLADLPEDDNTRRLEMLLEFGCKFDVDLSVSQNIGEQGSQWFEDEGETVIAAIYDDSSFTRVADSIFTHAVGDRIHVGVVAKHSDGKSVRVENCWITPSVDSNDATKRDIIIDGCAVDNNLNPDVLENGVTNYSRITLDGFHFNAQSEPLIFGHCEVSFCDGTCPTTCNRKSGRSNTRSEPAIVTFPIGVGSNEN